MSTRSRDKPPMEQSCELTAASHEGTIAGNVFDKFGSRNPIVRVMMSEYVRQMTDLLTGAAGSRLLEVGCGEGDLLRRVLDRLEFRAPVALDLDYRIMATVPRRAFRLQGRIEELPFRSGSFETVLAAQVLEHTLDPTTALRELCRVTRKYVVVAVPREPLWRILNLARFRYVRDLGNTPGHLQHWSAAEFVDFCSCSFRVLDVRRPIPWTMVLGRVDR